MDKSVFEVVRVNGELPDPSRVDVVNIVEDLWEAYIDSSTTLLNELEASAMSLERGDSVEENAAAIRRVLHTLKGEAGMVGMMDVHFLCHEAETAFDALLEQGCAADMVLKVKDWILVAIDFAQGADIQAAKHQLREQSQSDPDKLKTLIVEDDALCARRLTMLMGDFCDCDYASDGREGLEMYKQSVLAEDRYKLITLDINMPHMDGHETLTAIRRFEEANGIYGLDGVKIIMITSQETTDHVFGAFREGCEAYVIKSFMGDKLLDEMAKLDLLKTTTLYSIK